MVVVLCVRSFHCGSSRRASSKRRLRMLTYDAPSNRFQQSVAVHPPSLRVREATTQLHTATTFTFPTILVARRARVARAPAPHVFHALYIGNASVLLVVSLL